MNRRLLGSLAGILLASTAAAQNGTDDCTTPTPIGEGTFAFDTTTMVTDDGLTVGSCGIVGGYHRDMFWTYTATVAGDLTIDTAFSIFDTTLAVYSGTNCGDAVCIGENDNFAGAGSSQYTVGPVLPGDTFVIQVGGFASGDFGAGNLTLFVNSGPGLANDDCAGAEVLTGLGTFPFDSSNAMNSTYRGDLGCSLDTSIQDVFFQWTAPSDGDFSFETQTDTIAYDTRMAIYSGSMCDSTDVCLGSNDDVGTGAGNWYSRVDLTGVLSGTTLTIQIGTWNSAVTPGPNELYITKAPDGTACDLGIPITGAGDFAYDTTGFGNSGFNGGGTCASGANSVNSDFFFVWTADADGDFVVNTRLTTYDTKLSVHQGSDCSATCLYYNDDLGGGPLQSEVVILGALTGDQFLIQAGGFSANQGPATLTIAPAVDPCLVPDDMFEDNDDCTMPALLATGTYTALHVDDSDPDFYTISVPAGNILTVTETMDSDNTRYNLYDAGCGSLLIGDDFNGFSVNNMGVAAVSYVIEAFTPLGCADYDLELTIAPDPCAVRRRYP